ncbi:unnamed protein product, partial [Ilex paraguariensis]
MIHVRYQPNAHNGATPAPDFLVEQHHSLNSSYRNLQHQQYGNFLFEYLSANYQHQRGWLSGSSVK